MDYKEKIDKLRHSCSHVMAQAVKEIWPEVKIAIGPAIEDGFYYDFEKEEPFSDSDLKQIEKGMQKIINKNLAFTREVLSKKEATELFTKDGEKFKLDLIEKLVDQEISIYKTGDNFYDLCRGPHVISAGEIKAFKLLSVAGSYWRGDENGPRLQRIYGTCFFSKEELTEHLRLLEEAKKRDHRKLGPQLDLFQIYNDQAGAGLVFYHPKGALLRKIIEDYIKEQHLKRGYDLVITPNILKGHLWETSGHADYYRENMYFFDVDNEEYAVKPMNCPGHILIYKSQIRSYRELPLRYFELGTVYRNEKAGVLHGLLRVRGFTQDDAHIFCNQEQVTDEIKKVIDFVFDVLKDFGFDDVEIEISTRPEKFIGSIENWETATKALIQSLDELGLKYTINEGDGAFYGPKIDLKLKDALKRKWQCATVQCDFALPERFNLSYVDNDGKETRPIMLHRVILGSVERFFGTLIEHYGGAFPLWLAPTQVAIIPINEVHFAYAKEIKESLCAQGIRVIIDSRNESLSKRVREVTINKIPYCIVLGDKEQEEKKVSVRQYKTGDVGSFSIKDFINKLIEEIKEKKIIKEV